MSNYYYQAMKVPHFLSSTKDELDSRAMVWILGNNKLIIYFHTLQREKNVGETFDTFLETTITNDTSIFGGVCVSKKEDHLIDEVINQ